MNPPPIPPKDACGFNIGSKQARWIADYARAYAQSVVAEAIARVEATPTTTFESADWTAGEEAMRSAAIERLRALAREV